jgi:SAM-dependent methyltransferase
MTSWTKMFGGGATPASTAKRGRRQVNQEGWNGYARSWDVARRRGEIPGLPGDRSADAQHLGDEWSLMEDTQFPYGLDVGTVQSFAEHIDARMLTPFLPADRDLSVMEVGPGGGRITALLLPRARQLYAVDVSEAMLDRLQRRFAGDSRIVRLQTDGTHIAGIPSGSLDAAVTFDAFVHLEPWEIFRYLEIARTLLREGGIGIVHFSDVETPIGFRLFQSQVPGVIEKGVDFATFSVMSKSIMRRFLEELGFEIITITNEIIPRDAVAVFRRRRGEGGANAAAHHE